MENLYCDIKVYLCYTFSPHTIIVLIRRKNTQRNATRRLQGNISNAGAPPRGEQVPPLKEDGNMEQAPVHHPPLTDGDIRASLIQLDQGATVQAEAMTFPSQPGACTPSSSISHYYCFPYKVLQSNEPSYLIRV